MDELNQKRDEIIAEMAAAGGTGMHEHGADLEKSDSECGEEGETWE